MWAKVFLVAAFLSATLRLSEDSDVTLFRLMLPVAAAAFFVKNKGQLIRFCALCGIFAVFQALSFLVGGYAITYLQASFVINYLVMFFLYLFVEKKLEEDADGFYRFVQIIYCATVTALVLQFVTGVQLPNINDAEGKLNGWYWNENDASLALTAFMLLSLRLGFSWKLLCVHAVSISIVLFNGARGCLIGLLFYGLFWYFAQPLRSRHPIAFLMSIMFLLVVSLAGIYASIAYPKTVEIVYADVSGILSKLIFLREESFAVGSLQLRNNALVYAVNEFMSSYSLGIGAGSSIAMLQSGKYPDMVYVFSIHNMPMQFLLELGLPLFVLLVVSVWRRSPLAAIDFTVLVCTYFFVSLSQSGGFLVNYFAMVCFFVALKIRPRTPASGQGSGSQYFGSRLRAASQTQNRRIVFSEVQS